MCCGQFKPQQDRVLDLRFVAKLRDAPRQIGLVLQFSQFRDFVHRLHLDQSASLGERRKRGEHEQAIGHSRGGRAERP